MKGQERDPLRASHLKWRDFGSGIWLTRAGRSADKGRPSSKMILRRGNHRSHCATSPAGHVRRPAGSMDRCSTRIRLTSSRNQWSEPVHLTRSARGHRRHIRGLREQLPHSRLVWGERGRSRCALTFQAPNLRSFRASPTAGDRGLRHACQRRLKTHPNSTWYFLANDATLQWCCGRHDDVEANRLDFQQLPRPVAGLLSTQTCRRQEAQAAVIFLARCRSNAISGMLSNREFYRA